MNAAAVPRQGVRLGPIGLAWRPRILAVTLLLVALALGAGLVAAGIGQALIPPDRIIRAILGTGSPADRLIVIQLRLPRVLAGLLVGGALGLAGALAQTFARNPLATPDVIGVESGAAAGAVAAIVLGGGAYAVSEGVLRLGVPLAAFAGAIVAAALVYGLSWRGGIQGFRIVLVGIGVSAALTACTSYLLVLALVTDAGRATAWLVGSLGSIEWGSLPPLAFAVAIGTPVALATSAALRLDVLGDDAARGLGVRLTAHRLAVLGASVLLAAAATATAGPVSFVSLVCPQIAQRLARTDRPPLVAAMAAGALLVSAADTIGRSIVSWEIPVGLITVLLGAPYLLRLLVARRSALM